MVISPVLVRSTIQKLAYYVLPILLVAFSLLFPSSEWFKLLGNLSLLSLTLVLFIKPIGILTSGIPGVRWLMSLRREIGLTSFWFYLVHSVGQNILLKLQLSDIANWRFFLFWGALAGMGLWVMALTSNDFAVLRLGRNWKRLHRIVYVVYYFALYHSSTASGDMWKFFVFGGAFAVLKLAQYWKTGRL